MGDLRDKTIKGLFWGGLDIFSSKGLSFLFNLLIARQLSPRDYGVIAILAVMMAICQCFVDSGFGAALVRKCKCSETDFSTIFYFNIFAALLFYIILYAVAPFIASFYEQPIFVDLTKIYSLVLIINALAIVQNSKLTIEVNFKVFAKISIISAIISGSAALFMAYKGFGIWSLVVQALTSATVRSLLLWVFSRWTPKAFFSWNSLNEHFSFGSRLLGASLINTFVVKISLINIVMLTRFAVKNYRGFKNRIEWDLSHPSNYTFNNDAVRNGIVKNGIIYGPNGAGKSNFGLAIFDIANHLSHKWKKPDYYLNYACASCHNEPVDFDYTFSFDGHVVVYSYSKIASELKGDIISEKLTVDKKEILVKDKDELAISEEFGLTAVAIQNLKDSANNISIVNYLLSSVPLPKDHALLQLRDFVENMLFFRSLDYREFIGLKEGGSNVEEYIIKNNLADDFAAYLKEVSGQEYEFAPNTKGDNILFCIMNGVRIPFQWVASTGTRNLELQYYWLKEMDNASFVFIDEFDAFYHHELSYKICKRLFEGNNQVFVTTHDTFLLSNDLLRPDCFFILRNNEIKAICDLTDKELRFAHNLEKLYRGGTFGL